VKRTHTHIYGVLHKILILNLFLFDKGGNPFHKEYQKGIDPFPISKKNVISDNPYFQSCYPRWLGTPSFRISRRFPHEMYFFIRVSHQKELGEVMNIQTGLIARDLFIKSNIFKPNPLSHLGFVISSQARKWNFFL
jgi:hypothetical protein